MNKVQTELEYIDLALKEGDWGIVGSSQVRKLFPISQGRLIGGKVYLKSYKPNEQDFLNFVLNHYVQQAISELDDTKLPNILELKYQATADAKVKLVDISSIRNTFIAFQAYLNKDGLA